MKVKDLTKKDLAVLVWDIFFLAGLGTAGWSYLKGDWGLEGMGVLLFSLSAMVLLDLSKADKGV